MKFILTIYVYVFLSILKQFSCNEAAYLNQKSLKEKVVSVSAAEKAQSSNSFNSQVENAKTETSTAAITSATAQSFPSDNSDKKKFVVREIIPRKPTGLNMNLKLPDVDVYFQGWAHYYHYSILSKPRVTQPKLFFQNDRFFNQRIRKPHHKKTDQYGTLSIPNKAAFFMILYNKTLSVFSSRDDTMMRQVDMLSYNNINLIPEDNFDKGSVKDMGDFPTGSCVEIAAKIPMGYGGDKIQNYWIICFEGQKAKQIFRKTLIRLIIRNQRDKNELPFTVDQMNKRSSLAQNLKTPREPIKPENQSPLNGYWMLLQDWTDCTLACGGGWHYQHWMCIPPKFGGIDCIGDPIRRRPCNTQPCPPAKELVLKQNIKGILPIVKPTTINVNRFSSRPQRYSKCLIKENDAFLTKYDENRKPIEKLPVRILMNNRTITVFQDDDYSDMIFTYKLSNTNFKHSGHFCCFSLQDSEKDNQICGYPENCGDHEKNPWANQWKNDFTLFKTVCKTGVEEKMLTPEDEDNFVSLDANDPLTLDVVRRRKKQLKGEIIAENEKKLKKNVVQTQEVGFRVIEREFNIENMVKKEEKAKEEAELAKIEDQIKKEEKKASCVKKNIEEKELDDDWDDKLEAEEEIDLLKKKINLKVEDGRNRVKMILASMRKKAKIRRTELTQRLKEVRAKLANEIMLNNKEGSIQPCLKGRADPDFRETYCNTHFVEDYTLNSNCKSEDYCFTCCENEFGNAFRMKRSECYKHCDSEEKREKNMDKDDPKNKDSKKGTWTWAPAQKVK